jgi:hypothetical protein
MKKVQITWERRLYDTRPVPEYARTVANRRDVISLDSMKHTYEVDSGDWSRMLRCISQGDADQVRLQAATIVESARELQRRRIGRLEVRIKDRRFFTVLLSCLSR